MYFGKDKEDSIMECLGIMDAVCMFAMQGVSSAY